MNAYVCQTKRTFCSPTYLVGSTSLLKPFGCLVLRSEKFGTICFVLDVCMFGIFEVLEVGLFV